ncbi:TioE family transcriptional regulator [Actinoplanes sp. NBRC 101535]|uniref:TioE family transcriptional regulator n=1 Tax=Actinoplanes sp. NBRC 101535 TaxID=3032196 RepID=UPI002554364F|nr:TioE family transcriptional regulator [Actinoplanes sp. NBRC 101535]
MKSPRPIDLGRQHGLSAQAVRNYERDGCIPPARRTASGYRVYTEDHVGALSAYVALIRGYGHRTAGEIMRSVLAGAVDDAFAILDEAHVQLQRDRATVRAVSSAAVVLTAQPAADRPHGPVTVGVLAHRLGVTPATLRKWEVAGILAPERERVTANRIYSPADVRDAELAHLLRRGGYLLDYIAEVLRQVRAAGGPEPLAASLTSWQAQITGRGRRMLDGSAALAAYLSLRDNDAA